MGFNSAFKGLIHYVSILIHPQITRHIPRCCGTLFGEQWGRGCLFIHHICQGHL